MMTQDRIGLIVAWDHEFHTWADPYDDGETPMPGEHITDVWVELPRYGGIVVACETSAGRILSPWYDQSPHDGYCCDGECSSDFEFVGNDPDAYLDMMLGATEFTNWTVYRVPSIGNVRYWG